MNRQTPQQGCIARWLYGKGPRRLVDAVGGALHRIPAAFWGCGAIALGVVGIGAAGAAFWPKPLELGVPEAGVLQCVAATAEAPTEYAARMFYPRCLAAKREEARIQRLQRYSDTASSFAGETSSASISPAGLGLNAHRSRQSLLNKAA
jgi:hypothetical protein